MRQSRRLFLSMALASISLAPAVRAQNEVSDQSSLKDQPMKIQFEFDKHIFTATLENSPATLALIKMLPLSLTIEDYSNNEKIAYLPSKLSDDGSMKFSNESPGDLCYYAPWGNLVLYYASYRYSQGLVRLGRLDGSIEPLLTRGTFPLRIQSLK
jgi:hypothetical protein